MEIKHEERHPLNLNLADEARAETLKRDSVDLPSITLTHRQLCDLELLMNGGFTPLQGFLAREAYESVLGAMHLPSGDIWPIPVTLDVDGEKRGQIADQGMLALRDNEGMMLAVLHVEDCWKPDKGEEAERVYGTDSRRHPGVRRLYEETRDFYVGGRIEGLQLPTHYDFEELRHTPQDLQGRFARLGWRKVAAFHTSRPMHRLEHELTIRAAKESEAHILLHPVVGITMPRDLSYFARVKCYQALLDYYPHGLAALSLLPMAMRGAGPREALWHAVIRRNYGCTHIIIGSDHASPAHLPAGQEDFYGRYAGQELVGDYQEEIGIRMVPVERLAYAPARRRFVPEAEAQASGEETLGLSERDLADRLSRSDSVPDWFTFPEVLGALRTVYPPRHRQGLTLFFTGLSGAGKSTLAKIMYGKFIEEGKRPVTLLDGDIVRQNLSSELGFSKQHRDLNVRRIGFVASEITKNGGVAICAPIAPYATTRDAVREMIEEHGAMIEIHVSTPLEVCEARDRKGLYAKARKGIIPEFTGVSDPYESPIAPEISIDTSELSPKEAAEEIFLYLLREHYIDTGGVPSP